jgi:pimeloyl-ACP methyl ester carboxylesterase
MNLSRRADSASFLGFFRRYDLTGRKPREPSGHLKEVIMKRRNMPVIAAAVSLTALLPNPVEGAPFTSSRIHVVTRGHGPDIVFIPGLASHADVFAGTAEALEGRYRLHLVQVNGFAGSPAGDNASGPVMAPVAEEVVRYLAAAHLDHPVIIGHSMGGAIGMMIAARHPGAIGRLMIVDMIPFAGAFFVAPDATSETARPRAEQIAGQVLATPPGEISPLLQGMFSGMTRSDAARVRILSWLRASDRRVVAQSFREVITTDLRPELSRIAIPVTVLYVLPPGQTGHAVLDSAYANLPQARMVLVEDSNHFIMLDQPQRITSEIKSFMESEPSSVRGRRPDTAR